MKKIYVGFSTRKGSIFSWIIRTIEGTLYSHSYVRVDSRYGNYIYQATGNGVNFCHIDTFIEQHNVIIEEYEFEITEDQKDRIITKCIRYSNKRYGFLDLFKILAMLIANRIGWKLNLKGDGDRTFYCSELSSLLCGEIIPNYENSKSEFITPKMLNSKIKTYGKKVE